jgi:hypothetical protein
MITGGAMKFVLIMTYILALSDGTVDVLPQPKTYYTTHQACTTTLEHKLNDNQGVGLCRRVR